MFNKYSFEKVSKNKNKIIIIKEGLFREKKQNAIFFDRDGVLIDDKHYISDPNDVCILPGVKNLLQDTFLAGWINIVVTNQSGISRGFSNWKDYEKVTIEMIKRLGNKPVIHGIYANSEFPKEHLKNDWRKPSPNMILEASKEFNINLKKSLFIGDRLTDLLAAKNAGISKLVHVLTGHGQVEREEIINTFKESFKNKELILLNDLSSLTLINLNKKFF